MILTTAALGASVVLELVVEVEVDDIVRVGGVTGASDDSAGPLCWMKMHREVCNVEEGA